MSKQGRECPILEVPDSCHITLLYTLNNHHDTLLGTSTRQYDKLFAHMFTKMVPANVTSEMCLKFQHVRSKVRYKRGFLMPKTLIKVPQQFPNDSQPFKDQLNSINSYKLTRNYQDHERTLGDITQTYVTSISTPHFFLYHLLSPLSISSYMVDHQKLSSQSFIN